MFTYWFCDFLVCRWMCLFGFAFGWYCGLLGCDSFAFIVYVCVLKLPAGGIVGCLTIVFVCVWFLTGVLCFNRFVFCVGDSWLLVICGFFGWPIWLGLCVNCCGLVFVTTACYYLLFVIWLCWDACVVLCLVVGLWLLILLIVVFCCN